MKLGANFTKKRSQIVHLRREHDFLETHRDNLSDKFENER